MPDSPLKALEDSVSVNEFRCPRCPVFPCRQTHRNVCVCVSTHYCLSVTRSFNQLCNHKPHFFSATKTYFYFTQVCLIHLLVEKSDALLRDAIYFVFTIFWSSHQVLLGV